MDETRYVAEVVAELRNLCYADRRVIQGTRSEIIEMAEKFAFDLAQEFIDHFDLREEMDKAQVRSAAFYTIDFNYGENKCAEQKF